MLRTLCVATAFTHAFVALAAGKVCIRRPMPWKFWALAMACSALPASPFGGYKQSGFGREMSAHALEHYTQLKSVWVDLNM
jgi:acyl-CoA reductase-like NAD-dependent aldehyde dehydrogenase